MITPTEKAGSTVKILNFIKQAVNSVNDGTEVAKKIWDFLTKDYDLGYSEQNTELVAKTLHRMNTGTAPRIALVGMTSAGKSTLTNALFGKSIAEAKRTADTTNCIIKAEFPSGLVIYDTPGLGGDEELGYENITRLLLGLEQEEDATQFTNVPFQESPDKIVNLSIEQLDEFSSLDAVLFLMDVSRTLNKFDKKALKSFYLELEKKFEGRVVVAGTHYDKLLNEMSEDESLGQLMSYQKVLNDQLIPVSSLSGKGLEELVVNLFRIMPHKVSSAKLQESLTNTRKLTRRSFVITETSNILAEIILLKGDRTTDIQASYLWLFGLICKHYSVDDRIWTECNGDALKIAKIAQEKGVNGQNGISRLPQNLFENILSFIGFRFTKDVISYQSIGTEGLKELLPGVYKLLAKFSNLPESHKISDEIIQLIIEDKSEKLKSLIEQKKIEELGYQINVILESLFQQVKSLN